VVATVAFLLFFICLALGVLTVAMRGGPKGMRDAEPPSRRARRMWTVVAPIVLLIVGLGLPLWILSANSESHDKQEIGGVTLNDSQARGRVLFATNCATCHTLDGAAATGKVGPNLDELTAVQNTAFTLNAIKQGRAQGNGQMPRGLLDGQDAEDVANFIKAVAGR
jgi:mono/diheme cytochrome c family protein